MAAGGHAASNSSVMYEETVPAGENRPSVLLKPLDTAELEVYERLANVYPDDSVHGFVPGFHGVHQDGDDSSKQFLRLGNLLQGFSHPKVMDVKLGKRTFLHKETRNTKPRTDLFQKMVKDFPSDLTSVEREAEAVTKSRYMACRDANSTSGMYGFRVSGTAGCSDGCDSSRTSLSESDEAVDTALREFAKGAASQTECSPAEVAEKLVEELQRLRSALEASEFVRRHECVGTSALLVADAESGRCRAFWIDFAKTCVCECAQGLTHREALSNETQEEGLLVGIDNLISAWKSVTERLSEESLPALLSTEAAVSSDRRRSLL